MNPMGSTVPMIQWRFLELVICGQTGRYNVRNECWCFWAHLSIDWFKGKITGTSHDLHGKIGLVSGDSIFPSTNPVNKRWGFILMTGSSHHQRVAPRRLVASNLSEYRSRGTKTSPMSPNLSAKSAGETRWNSGFTDETPKVDWENTSWNRFSEYFKSSFPNEQ